MLEKHIGHTEYELVKTHVEAYYTAYMRWHKLGWHIMDGPRETWLFSAEKAEAIHAAINPDELKLHKTNARAAIGRALKTVQTGSAEEKNLKYLRTRMGMLHDIAIAVKAAPPGHLLEPPAEDDHIVQLVSKLMAFNMS